MGHQTGSNPPETYFKNPGLCEEPRVLKHEDQLLEINRVAQTRRKNDNLKSTPTIDYSMPEE